MFTTREAKDLSGEFQTALNLFLTGAQGIIDSYYAANFPNVEKPNLVVQIGAKNVKVINQKRGVNESVYCFIDIATGNVLKAAGWKAPAKGARGNIYSPQNGTEGVDAYGGRYASGKVYVHI
jgi:hypothetical protein